ncbi:MAG: NUDIX domain-containing protein [Chloroflexia bacterium]|nr:NUDIX domain-containing protein [Chloroflexia bacterium]
MRQRDVGRRPGVGVGVLVERGGEILLVRRKHHGAGTWAAPGGYLDLGEELTDAARREVREETGLEIAEVRFVAVVNDRFDDGKHNVTIWFAAGRVEGEATVAALDELSEVAWFAWDALPEQIYSSTRRFLDGESLPAAAIDRLRPEVR